MRKKYLVNGEYFEVLCDAQELSYQLARNFYVKTLTEHKKLVKFDDRSWGVHNPVDQEWLFVSKVEKLL